jgi:predicted nucleotidyltransferase component of viral defense system
MINKEEIIQKSEEFEINSSNVQRDYIFGWVLTGIYTISGLKDYLILKGGNCLRKAYFENTRFSNDLDFAIETSLPEEFIATELNKVCDFVCEVTGVKFQKDRLRIEEKNRVDPKEKKIYEVRLYFNDFFGNESSIIISIRLDITQFDKIYLPIQRRFIIHPYSDLQSCKAEVRCLKLEEVLASKLKCLLQRRHSCDLYDYVFSIIFDTGIVINRIEIAKTLLRMTIFERNPGVLRGLLFELPFHLLKSLWDKYLVYPKNAFIDFEYAVERFKKHLNELFSELPTVFQNDAFFPANRRNVILQAGYDMTLLKIVYDGISRLVEPYSLVYKTRKTDGVASEYLYVYDRTGGTSGPGIKAFFNSKIQLIEITDEKFEPRYHIELSKAGEMPKNSYFGKPFSEGYSSARIKRSSSIGRSRLRISSPKYPVHIYQCYICGKKFRKKEYNSSLKRHKDKYDNWCFGAAGIYVETKY